MVYQWWTAGDTPPTTSQYSADTRSICYSAAGEGELEIRSASIILAIVLSILPIQDAH